MNVASILQSTFAVPVIDPDWPRRLLLVLSGIETGLAAQPPPVAPAPTERSREHPCGACATPAAQPFSVDMGLGSREQQYSRQKPFLRIVPPARP